MTGLQTRKALSVSLAAAAGYSVHTWYSPEQWAVRPLIAGVAEWEGRRSKVALTGVVRAIRHEPATDTIALTVALVDELGGSRADPSPKLVRVVVRGSEFDDLWNDPSIPIWYSKLLRPWAARAGEYVDALATWVATQSSSGVYFPVAYEKHWDEIINNHGRHT